MKKVHYATIAAALLPCLALAENFDDLITKAKGWVGTLTDIAAALALLVFIWGLVKYIWAAGDEASKASGKKIMVGGVIALFVLFSIWGIVQFLQSSLGVDNGTTPKAPEVSL